MQSCFMRAHSLLESKIFLLDSHLVNVLWTSIVKDHGHTNFSIREKMFVQDIDMSFSTLMHLLACVCIIAILQSSKNTDMQCLNMDIMGSPGWPQTIYMHYHRAVVPKLFWSWPKFAIYNFDGNTWKDNLYNLFTPLHSKNDGWQPLIKAQTAFNTPGYKLNIFVFLYFLTYNPLYPPRDSRAHTGIGTGGVCTFQLSLKLAPPPRLSLHEKWTDTYLVSISTADGHFQIELLVFKGCGLPDHGLNHLMPQQTEQAKTKLFT